MNLAGYTTVRAPKGTKIHIVRAIGDFGVGATLCGLRNRGWIIVPDVEPDCRICTERATAVR